MVNIFSKKIGMNLIPPAPPLQELPFKKLPVLKHGDLTIAESTSILRYVALSSGTKHVRTSHHV